MNRDKSPIDSPDNKGRDGCCPSSGPELRGIERLLAQAGRDWRRSARARGMPADKAERVTHAVLRASEREQAVSAHGGVDVWSWLRSLLRPLGYGIAGAVLVAVWFVGIQPTRSPIGEMLYGPNGSVSAIPPTATASIVRGAEVNVDSAPGTLLQLNERAQLLLKPGSRMVVESRDRISLSQGAAWIFLSGRGGDFHVNTPQGRVTATGTTFGVETGRALEVTLLEGTVVIGAGATAFRATQGQRVQVNAPGATAILLAGAAETPAWAENLLDAYRKAFFERYFPSATPPVSSPRPR